MLTKPDIADELIISRLQEEYGLRVTSLTFLPLGADVGSVSYRIVVQDGTAYFLKLRKGFVEIVVTVPLFLKSQGIQEIIIPFETKSKQHWADFGEYKMILYPFIEGKDGFSIQLTNHHWQTLGRALKKIHTTKLPLEIKRLLEQETYSPRYRDNVKSFQQLIENKTFNEPTAAKLAEFMKSKRGEITRIIDRAESLASALQSQPLELVLCHADMHGGNVLISDKGEIYIVDWDYPILSDKEHDLMFIGGWFFPNDFNNAWEPQQEEIPFYEGYGKTSPNLAAMTYYRYDRIINDISAYCEQLLLTNDGGTDREPAFKSVTENFDPGGMIESVDATYNLL